MSNLKLRYAGFVCTPPVLESVVNNGTTNFDMSWNYQGVNHDSYSTSTKIEGQYSLDSGITWIDFPETYDFPLIRGSFSAVIEWTVIWVRVVLSNIKCDISSNVIIIDIT